MSQGSASLVSGTLRLVGSSSAAGPDPAGAWFSVRTILRMRGQLASAYEERVTLWRAATFEQAVTLAEQDARDHARNLTDCTYAGLAQAYQLFDEPGHGAEVFEQPRQGRYRG